jgi:sugar (pentulose or hexulose) kinase
MLVAVIDIGKTNKKIALVDRALTVRATRQASFPARLGEDGVLVEQVEAIWAWLRRELATLFREQPFHAISVSTHGACWVALDGAGRPSVPVIAYEHDLGAAQAAFDGEFYRRCGPLERLQDETGSCDLPLLVNPAKGIAFAQRTWPTSWGATRAILNYPQYWGFLLTGQQAAEPTCTANHSFLFAVRDRAPSSAARLLGVDRLIDWDLRQPWDRLGTLSADLQSELNLPALPVTVGIHDSNAALLPYLVKYRGRDFVLNSTGTWCVAMHQVERVAYREDELGQKVIFNIDAFGRYHKTSFLMGGMDYGLYHGLIGGRDPGFDARRVDAALARGDRAVLPGAYPSQFPACSGGLRHGSTTVELAALRQGKGPAWFTDAASGHDLLNISLALQSEVALRRTDIGPGTAIFVEGGFRNNPTFLAVLAALFPTNPVVVTSLAQASSAGAALLGHALLEQCHPLELADGIVISEEAVARPRLGHLGAYRTAWLAAAATAAPSRGSPRPKPAAKPKPKPKASAKPAARPKPKPKAGAKAKPAAKTRRPAQAQARKTARTRRRRS